MLALGFACSTGAQAQAINAEALTCGQYVEIMKVDATAGALVSAWFDGYLSREHDMTDMDLGGLAKAIPIIAQECAKNPNSPFADFVVDMAKKN